jgi:hypothetical protein
MYPPDYGHFRSGRRRPIYSPMADAATSRNGLLVGLAALAAAAGLAGLVRLGTAPGAAALVQPSDRQIAQRAVDRHFTLVDQGRGSEFCSEAITSATLDAEGGIYSCATAIDDYVKQIQRQTFAALTDVHLLFYMVDDGIGSHCSTGQPCPRNLYGRWAGESASPGVGWRTSSDPRQASSDGAKIVAVVDPRLVAIVSMRVGTATPTVEQFQLVNEGRSWRVDSWMNVTAALTV